MSRRFQFSLRTMLAVTAIVGTVAVTFLGEHHLAMRFTPFLCCGTAAAMVVAGDRYARAFGAASLLPLGIGAVLAIRPFFDIPTSFLSQGTLGTLADANFDEPYVDHYRFRIAFLWVAGAASGLVGIALAWLFAKDRS
jgi:hypothetical protein